MDVKELLKYMRDYATQNKVPIIEQDGLDILITLLQKYDVKNMLEIGSAIGYSAIAANFYTDVNVDTIEREEELYKLANENIMKIQKQKVISTYLADALTFDDSKLGKYDCIYIDAAKAQYKSFLCKYEKHLNENGIIIFDNLLFHGFVNSDMKYSKSKSFEQMINKIESFIKYVRTNPKYQFELIEKGDGIGVLKLNKDYDESLKKITITYHDYDTLKLLLEKNNEYIKMINIGSNQYGLRQAVNASIEEICDVVELAKLYDVEVYVMCNKLMHNSQLEKLRKYLRQLEKIKVDGVVFSDLAVIYLINELNINLNSMYSTETTITNNAFTKFAKENKITSIELAKEITAKEINEILANKKSSVSVYIHGHLYMYQSVRKMITNFENIQNIKFNNEDKDFYLYDDERDSYYPIIENAQGTHLLSSKDLCMVNKLDKLDIENIDNMKIDGFRYSSAEYLRIIDIYSQALKSIKDNSYQDIKKNLLNDIKENSSKKYFTGFFFKQTLY